MKKLNFTILVFFLVVISCKGQSSDIDTFAGPVNINNQITLGDTQQATINAFGQPDNITTEYWETEEKTATNYHYNNGAQFQFIDSGLASFIITSSNYYIKMGSFQLKAGNNISSIQSRFPKSYNFKSSGGTSIALGTGDYRFIFIEFNSNNIITKIEIRFF